MAKAKTVAAKATSGASQAVKDAEARKAETLANDRAHGGKSAEELAAELANKGPRDDRLRRQVGIVARGRTVTTEDGTFTHGQEVRCTADEIARLRKIKFLVDPRENLLPLGNGPKFFQEDEAAKDTKEPA